MEIEAEPDEPEDNENNAREAYKEYLQRKSQATVIIYGSCSSSVKVYNNGMRAVSLRFYCHNTMFRGTEVGISLAICTIIEEVNDVRFQ